MTFKVLNFDEKINPIDEKTVEKIKGQIELLMKAISEQRLTQIMIQFEEEIDNNSNKDITNVNMIFWNNSGNFDQAIGFAERFKKRVTDIAEYNATKRK